MAIFIFTVFGFRFFLYRLCWNLSLICPFFEKRKWLLKSPLFILPSLLFWGSGLLKESLVMLCVGLYYFQLDLAAFKKWNYQKTAGFAFFIILWFMKPL
jgi:hypothetical protein